MNVFHACTYLLNYSLCKTSYIKLELVFKTLKSLHLNDFIYIYCENIKIFFFFF